MNDPGLHDPIAAEAKHLEREHGEHEDDELEEDQDYLDPRSASRGIYSQTY